MGFVFIRYKEKEKEKENINFVFIIETKKKREKEAFEDYFNFPDPPILTRESVMVMTAICNIDLSGKSHALHISWNALWKTRQLKYTRGMEKRVAKWRESTYCNINIYFLKMWAPLVSWSSCCRCLHQLWNHS